MLARKKEEMLALQHGIDYLNQQEKKEVPLVWIFIDEAHEFLPKEGKTSASDALRLRHPPGNNHLRLLCVVLEPQ
jgi:hypothetical protein